MRVTLHLSFSLTVVLTLVTGCATQRAQETERDSWLARHGGIVEGSCVQLARCASESLLQSFPQTRLRVFDSPTVAAYSWRDGTIALSRGLVASLSPDEIAAAVAHELGHLVNDGWLSTPSALSGSGSSMDEESKADATAVVLLKESGRSPTSLSSALGKVLASGNLTETQRTAIRLRIQRLESPRR